jgi:hypothetical protein
MTCAEMCTLLMRVCQSSHTHDPRMPRSQSPWPMDGDDDGDSAKAIAVLQDRARRASLPADPDQLFHFVQRRPVSFALHCNRTNLQRKKISGQLVAETNSVHEALTVLDDTRGVRWDRLKVRERWLRVGRLVRATVLLKKKFPWFQLSGHGAEFQQHQSPEWVLKKASKNELAAFAALKGDPLAEFTPIYTGVIRKGDDDFMQLQNLLFGFSSPCVDCPFPCSRPSTP